MKLNLLGIKRKTRQINMYHHNMGTLICNITKIKLTFFGIPIKTLHAYRETYHGEIKRVENCKLGKI